MKVYSIDLVVAATAYIKAENEEEAIAKIREFADGELMVEGTMISDAQFRSPNLPDVSLSPAMTIHGPWQGQGFQEVADLEEEVEEEV